MVLSVLLLVACGQSAVPLTNFVQRGCRDRGCWTHTLGRDAEAGALPTASCSPACVFPQYCSSGGVCTNPQFSFATPSGTGMTAVCAGTSVTGVLGETITFARNSVRTCMKGNETSGIANGDLVKLTANQPAVQYGFQGAGTLGLSLWAGRTNTLIKSEKLDTAVTWNVFGLGAAAPTVTANAGTAPDGTATAERVQIAATTSAQRSILYQLNACANGQNAISCFVKGVSNSGVTELALDDTNGWTSAPCSYTNASWTRCYAENVPQSTSAIFAIGNVSDVNGGTPRLAADVLVWGCQCELGGSLGPYIPTDATTVTTATDVATAAYTAAGSSISVAASMAPVSFVYDSMNAATLSFDATNEVVIDTLGTKNQCNVRIADTGARLASVANRLTPSTQTASCAYAPSSRYAADGTSEKSLAGALTIPTGSATIYIGGQFDGGAANATVANVCVDPAHCRVGATVTCPVSTTNSQTVANIGDSIMVGAFQQKMLDEMQDRLCSRAIGVVNYAVSGSTITDCADQYHTSVKGHGYRDVATQCGINNIVSAGDTAAVAWAKMESLLEDITRGDGGYHVVLGNLTPCMPYVNACGDGHVTDFNAKEHDWCVDAGSLAPNGWATCLDNYALLGTSSEPLTYSFSRGATYLGSLCVPSTDNLHPNNYCTTKLADSFADAIP